jgi:hypothetical protein
MKNKIVIIVFLITVTLIGSCNRIETVSQEITAYAPQSEFIFQGLVQVLSTSTVDAEDPSNMGVVKVEKIISAPENLKSIEGEQITVKFKNPKEEKQNVSKIFFTNVSLYGESIAVTEIGSMKTGEQKEKMQTLKQQIEKVKQQESDKLLKERILNSEKVVSGKVIKVTKLKDEWALATEHSPQWAEAEILANEILKGDKSEKISILFALSYDELFEKSPKLKEGDSGIFLLRRNNTHFGDKDKLSLVHNEDLLPLQEIERVKKVMK